MYKPLTTPEIRRQRKLEAKWQAMTSRSVELRSLENCAGFLGFTEQVQMYQDLQVDLAANMKRFARRHGMLDRYNSFFDLK
jgi:hypothetical protein